MDNVTTGISFDKHSFIKTVKEIWDACLAHYYSGNFLKFPDAVKTLDVALEGYKDEPFNKAAEDLNHKYHAVIMYHEEARQHYYEQLFTLLQNLLRRRGILPMFDS